jgi:predicted porin
LKTSVPTLLVLAGCALAGATSTHAQSSVTLGGVVDLALRHSNHQGADGRQTLTTLDSGGLTPSRVVITVNEDLGEGRRALVHLDSRYTFDTGGQTAGPAFTLSYVGLSDPQLGRVTLGRQYNVLFDAMAFSYAPFITVGPYLNTFKPETTMLLGAASDNMLKVQYSKGPLLFEAQAGAGEGSDPVSTDPTTIARGKTLGAMLKVGSGPWSVAGAVLSRELSSGRAARGAILGTAWRDERLFLNAYAARNRFDDGFNTAFAIIGQGFADTQVAAGFASQSATRVRQRDMVSFGGSYDLAPAWTLGAQLWQARQRYHDALAPTLRYRGLALLADYRLSKRTDLYATVEHAGVRSAQFVDVPTRAGNGATARTNLMLGVRQRF